MGEFRRLARGAPQYHRAVAIFAFSRNPCTQLTRRWPWPRCSWASLAGILVETAPPAGRGKFYAMKEQRVLESPCGVEALPGRAHRQGLVRARARRVACLWAHRAAARARARIIAELQSAEAGQGCGKSDLAAVAPPCVARADVQEYLFRIAASSRMAFRLRMQNLPRASRARARAPWLA
jgi:hypothetical protein